MATGKRLYYILARNLLISYRLHNPDPQPFALICDRRNEITEEFDDVVIMDSPSFSFNDKLRLADLTPYDETIFIDADCLVVRNLSGLWDIVKDSPELLLQHKVDFDDRLIVGLAKCPDGFRLANLPGPFHYQRFPLWVIFPIPKILVYLPFKQFHISIITFSVANISKKSHFWNRFQ